MADPFDAAFGAAGKAAGNAVGKAAGNAVDKAAASFNPYAAAFGAATDVAKSALDDKTNQTSETSFGSSYDGSGWVVNIGSGSASNSQSRSELGNLLGMLNNPMVLAAICIGLYLYSKR
jgi:hypothetical protein